MYTLFNQVIYSKLLGSLFLLLKNYYTGSVNILRVISENNNGIKIRNANEQN